MNKSSEVEDIKPEFEIDPHIIGIATTTFYPTTNLTDQVRGKLAIKTIREALNTGLQITIIDGGSSESFIKELKGVGVSPQAQKEPGMSASRRQAFEEISNLSNIQVLCWLEPEKLSMVNLLSQAALPILRGEADIVIPKRDEGAFATYPQHQIKSEIDANLRWNQIMKRNRLLSPDAEDLDIFFGPRLFKNDPNLIALFLKKYEFEGKPEVELDKVIKPELWPNATMLPIVAALDKGYRVKSITVPYRHTKEQTDQENNDEEFQKKRNVQRKNILATTLYYILKLKGHEMGDRLKLDVK